MSVKRHAVNLGRDTEALLNASESESETDTEAPTVKNELLQPFLQENEEVLHTAETDMTIDGFYRDGWLVVTDKRCFTAFAGDNEPAQERWWRDIEGADLKHSVGNGVLLLDCREDTVVFARYSLRFAVQFEEALDGILGRLRRLGKVEEPDEEEHRPRGSRRAMVQQRSDKRCPNCGGPLRHGVCMKCMDKRKLLIRVLQYLVPYLPQASISMVLLIIGGGLQMVQPHLTGRLVDDVLTPKDMGLLWRFVSILAIVFLSGAVINGIRTYIMSWVGQRVVRDLRSHVFQHLQYLRMQFYDHIRTGSIMSRATNDTQHIQRFVVQSAQNLIYQAVMVIGVGAVMFTINWKLALFTIAPMPLIIWATRLFSIKVHRIYRRIWVRQALMNSVLADSIPGIAVVKSFAQENRTIEKFNKQSDHVFYGYVTASRFRAFFTPFLSFATNLGTLCIWGLGGYLVIQDQTMSTGDIVAFLYYLNQFYNPLRQLSSFSDVIQEAATAAERVFEILDTEPEVKDQGKEIKLTDMKGEIEFRDVHFAYDTGEPVLENVNVHIKPGEMIGLVGPSGSGKTTMANLIPRMYDVTTGELLIDGENIRDLELRSLRSQIGVVLQEPLLFHGTIADNIAYGVPNASREQIIWAAQAANAHEFIMSFPDGYDTHTGERGLRLSGGQKQRISIARAILKNPKILILDEATSSVDTETEKLIQEAIDRLIANRTTIAIAHRLSTLKNADRLLVVEDGHIVEQGTHDELMENDGVFARLVKMQSEISNRIAV